MKATPLPPKVFIRGGPSGVARGGSGSGGSIVVKNVDIVVIVLKYFNTLFTLTYLFHLIGSKATCHVTFPNSRLESASSTYSSMPRKPPYPPYPPYSPYPWPGQCKGKP